MSKRLKQSEPQAPDWRGVFLDRNIVNYIIAFIPVISVMSLVRSIKGVRERLGSSVYMIARERIWHHLERAELCSRRLLESMSLDGLTPDILTGGALLGALTNADWLPAIQTLDFITGLKSTDVPQLRHIAESLSQPGPPSYTIMCVDNAEVINSTAEVCIVEFADLNTGTATIRSISPIDYTDANLLVNSFDTPLCVNSLSPTRLYVENPIDILVEGIYADFDTVCTPLLMTWSEHSFHTTAAVDF